MPMSNRKTSPAKTPLLPLAISKTVTKSDAAKITSLIPTNSAFTCARQRACSQTISELAGAIWLDAYE
jgi:hypothetical protein